MWKSVIPHLFVSHKPKSMCSSMIHGKSSNFQRKTSGAPQGFITGPVLFNVSINDLFFFVLSASMYNFADDISLSVTTMTVAEFQNTDSDVVINWFKSNKMIVNPENSKQSWNKQKYDYLNETNNWIIEQKRLRLPSNS